MRFLLSGIVCLTVLPLLTIGAQVSVGDLLTENLKNPKGLDQIPLRFSWKLIGERRGILQSAYDINVFQDADLIWNSGKTQSDQSTYVPYAGPSLNSDSQYRWQVRIWDDEDQVSEWSEHSTFHLGFLETGDWQAKWIEIDAKEPENRPAQLFRKEFSTKKRIKSARLYSTAHGIYEAFINGAKVGQDYFTPGWTSYGDRIQYQVYEVGEMLERGPNTLAMHVGNGWYRGNLAWENQRDIYGETLGVLVQLMITYEDGSSEIVISDDTWKGDFSAVHYNEIYHGEIADARAWQTGWNTNKFDDEQWSEVREVDYPMDKLVGTHNEPVRKQETFPVIRLLTSPKGEKILDFGQNLVGFVTVRAQGEAGDTIVLSHSEVLDKEGNFYTESLRAAKQQNTYILRGESEEVFEPRFTWQGFRYVRVDEFPGTIDINDFIATALYSDMPLTGSFNCSDQLINQLQHNIQWGQRGNFIDVPTDCPQRDERLGWTGDAQAFFRTAAFNFDVHNFFVKWLKDLAADQGPDGRVPFVIPHVLGENAGGSAGWADAATIIPWNMYLAYGDKRILEDQYKSMQSWIRFMMHNSTDFLWNKGFHFGDWLFYRPSDDNDGRSAVTDKYLIAQCFFAHSTQLMVNTAKVLGNQKDEALYTALLKNVKDAFLREYVTPSGRLASNTQTAYVLALNFDMLPDHLRQQAAERLVENIRSYNNHLTTGFLGTPYLCHVLSRYGYKDVAFDLLLQKTYPSWLYPVTMGATTIWERWDGIKPDSTFQTPNMNSFNHYAYGAIGDWMYRVLVGLDNHDESVGYKKIRIKPHLGGELTHASLSFDSPYGAIQTGWKIIGGKIELSATIPPNTEAILYLPTTSRDKILESGQLVDMAPAIKYVGSENEYTIFSAGSGTYHFTMPK